MVGLGLSACTSSLFPFGQPPSDDPPSEDPLGGGLAITSPEGELLGLYDFGTQVMGESVGASFLVSNRGLRVARLEEPVLAGAGAFEVSAFECAETLAPGAHCALEISFSPGFDLEVTGLLLIPYTAGDDTQAAALSLTGATDVVSLPREQVLTVSGGENEGTFYALGGVFEPWSVAPLTSGFAGAGAFRGESHWVFLRFVVDSAVPPGAVITSDTRARLWFPHSLDWEPSQSLIIAAERSPGTPPTEFWDHPDNLVGVSLFEDPGFETTAGDWGAGTYSRTTVDPIAGTASLSVNVAAWSQLYTRLRFPEGSFVAPSEMAVSLEARLQGSVAGAQLCGTAEYAAGPTVDRCVALALPAGETGVVQVTVPMDPTRQPISLLVTFVTEGQSLQGTFDNLDVRVFGDPGRRLTTAQVTWGEGGFAPVVSAWNDTPSLESILQEVVNVSGGLEPGDGVVLWLRGGSKASEYRLPVGASMGSPPRAAQLFLHWRLFEE